MKATGGMAASKAQQAKVKDLSCVECWQGPCDPAHLIDRSVWPDRDGHPLRVVPLCRRCHDAYDARELDLLAAVERDYPDELAYAVQFFGLVATLNRVTGARWEAIG